MYTNADGVFMHTYTYTYTFRILETTFIDRDTGPCIFAAQQCHHLYIILDIVFSFASIDTFFVLYALGLGFSPLQFDSIQYMYKYIPNQIELQRKKRH